MADVVTTSLAQAKLLIMDSDAIKYWRIDLQFDAENPAAPGDCPANSYTYTSGARLGAGWFADLNPEKYYYVYCYVNKVNPAVRQYQVFEAFSGSVFAGYSADGGETVRWKQICGGMEGVAYWRIDLDYDSENPAAPGDMPVNSYFYASGARLGTGWFEGLDPGKYYYIYCFASGVNPAVRHYQAYEANSGTVYEGFTTSGGETVRWTQTDAMAYWRIDQSFSAANPAAPSDFPSNRYTYTSGARLGSGWFDALNTGKYYFIYCYANAVNPAVRHYQVFERDSGNVYEGYTSDSGATVSWARAGEDEEKKGLAYWLIHQSHDAGNPASPSDMPINSYFYSGGSRLGAGWFSELDAGKYYFVYCHANMYNPAVRHYQAFEKDSGNVYEGYTTNSGAAVSWAKASGGGSGGRGKTLKVLSIGSSFGQDCTVYAPWLMEEMDAGTAVTFGIVYMSGGTISQYNGWFDDGTALNYYKRAPGADAWASGTQKSLKAVLDDETWDVILVNQSAAQGGDWASFGDLETYLEKMASYIGHPVKFGYLMPQKALPYSYTYEALVDCARKAYDSSVVSFVVPAGAAIELARGTALNSLGDAGGLTADASVGHLQEGLPVLIANYVTAAALLDMTDSGIDKIMGCTLFPTAAWVAGHNIPGQNGTSTGVTAANVLLGQRCAVQAVKTPLFDDLPGAASASAGDFLRLGDDKTAVWETVSLHTPRVVMTAQDTAVSLSPNTLYVFPEMASLSVALAPAADSRAANEYHFFFESGDTPTDFSITGIKNGGEQPDLEANKLYEVSVLEGIAAFAPHEVDEVSA